MSRPTLQASFMSSEEQSLKTLKKQPVISANRIDRALKVFDLRRSGRTSFRTIGGILKAKAEEAGESTRGYSHTQVKSDYELAIRLKSDQLGNMLIEARILAGERLEDIYLRIGPLLDHAKPNVKLKAANVLIRANREFTELHGARRPLFTDKREHSGTIAIYSMTKEEWEREAALKLSQVVDQLGKFDEQQSDNSEDTDQSKDLDSDLD